MKKNEWGILGVTGCIFSVIGRLVAPIPVMAIRYADTWNGKAYGYGTDVVDNVPFITYNTPYATIGGIIIGIGVIVAVVGFSAFAYLKLRGIER